MQINTRTLASRRLARVLALGAAVLWAAGCGGALDSVDGTGTPPPPGGTELRATLRGTQEVPAVQTLGSGSASAILSADQSTLTVTLQTQGLTNVQLAHIHVATVGQNGPIILPLYDAATDGAFPATLSRVLTAADLQPQPAAGVTTFADAVQAILNGRTYINVHTQQNPGGEIRGQLGPVSLRAVLSGDNEVPPVITTATGNADIVLNGLQSQVQVVLTTSGLQNVVAAHIHVGAAGEEGGIILPLYDASIDGVFPAVLTRVVTAADLQAQPTGGIANFDDAINAILSGNTYVNVHTQQNPDGEIRGQITP